MLDDFDFIDRAVYFGIKSQQPDYSDPRFDDLKLADLPFSSRSAIRLGIFIFWIENKIFRR